MKIKIVSALLLVAMIGATAAEARPLFAVNPALGGVPVVSQSIGSVPVMTAYGYGYPPGYYRHHRRWHRHW